jgi:membrane-associated phospholipid phosphatase
MPGGPPLEAGADPVTLALGVLTQLGDSWFLALVAIGLYWLGRATPLLGPAIDRDRIATVVAVVLVAIGLATALKAWFALERPAGARVAPTVPTPTVESLVAWLTGASGYGFPSGHGVVATAGWGGLAWAIRRGRARHRIAVAAVVVTAVGASRVALGLHTPTQVAAGVLAGIAALAAVLALGRPARGFGLAAAVGLCGGVAVGPLPELVAVGGLGAGAAVAWFGWGDRLRGIDARAGALLGAGLGMVTVVPVLGLLAATKAPGPVHLVAGLLAGAAMLATPLVGEWLAIRWEAGPA